MSDSVQDLLIDIAIRENNKPTSRLVSIPTSEYLQSINVDLVMNGGWTGTVVLFDYEGYALEELLLSSSLSNREVELRWGWAARDGKSLEGSVPTLFGIVTKPTPQFTPEGVTLTLELAQNETVSAALGKENRILTGDFSASELLQVIARERKWKTKDALGRSTIQTNDVRHAYTDAITGWSDTRLFAYLAARTVDPAGNVFRFFFGPRGEVHFHTDNFLAKEAAKEYIFSRDAMGEVERFEPTEESVYAAVLAGAGAKFVATDSKSKTTVNRSAEQGEALPGGKNTVVNDAAYEPDLGSGLAARVSILGRDPRDLDSEMKSRRDVVRNAAMKAELDVHGTHDVSPLDRVRVDYYMRNGTLHFLSGLYQVMKVSHEVGTNGWTTGFDLFRPGGQYTRLAKMAEADKKLDVTASKPPDGSAEALVEEVRANRARLPVRE